jgi:hypothetical protein
LVFFVLGFHAALSSKIIFLFQMQGPDTYVIEERRKKERRKMKRK